MQAVGEMSFELVLHPDGVDVYLVDDGEDVGTGGLDAKITITRDANGLFKGSPRGQTATAADCRASAAAPRVLR